MNDQMQGIPSISADGTTASIPPPDSGNLLSKLHGGMDVLYGRRAQEVLNACTPLPVRLLLSCAVETRKNRREHALAAALAIGLFAMFPAVIALGLLSEMHVRSKVVLALPLMAVAGTMISIFLREVRSPKNAWQRTLWLDFENRELRLRHSLLDDHHPTVTDSIPFADLTLVCFPYQWEVALSFDIGLSRKDQLQRNDSADPPCLCMIHTSNDEYATRGLATALAMAWGMECHARLGDRWTVIATTQATRAGV